MVPYHDRMPVLLSGADIEGWLDGEPRRLPGQLWLLRVPSDDSKRAIEIDAGQ